MNIYTASAKDLQNLKGIGAKLAEKIVHLRLTGTIVMEDLVTNTNIPVQTWLDWEAEGKLSLKKPDDDPNYKYNVDEYVELVAQLQRQLRDKDHKIAEDEIKLKLLKANLETREEKIQKQEKEIELLKMKVDAGAHSVAAQEDLVKIDQNLKDLEQQYHSNVQDIESNFKEQKEKYREDKKRCDEEYELDCNKLLAARHDAGSRCGVMFSPTSQTETGKVKAKSQDCRYQSDSDTSDECNDINPLHSHKKLVGNLSEVLPPDGVYRSVKSEPPIDPYFSRVVQGPILPNRDAIGSQSQGYLGGESYQSGGRQPTASYHEHLQSQGYLGRESYQSQGHVGGFYQPGGPTASFQGRSYQSGGCRPTASFHRKPYQSHIRQSQVMHQEHSYVTDNSQLTVYFQNVPHQTAGSQPTVPTQGASLQPEQNRSTSIHTETQTNDSQTATLSNVQADNISTEIDHRRDSDRNNSRDYDRNHSGGHYDRNSRYQSGEDQYQYHRSRYD